MNQKKNLSTFLGGTLLSFGMIGTGCPMEGFRDDVTLDELNGGATFDDDVLSVDPALIPNYGDEDYYESIYIAGLPSGTHVCIGDDVFRIVLDRIFRF